MSDKLDVKSVESTGAVREIETAGTVEPKQTTESVKPDAVEPKSVETVEVKPDAVEPEPVEVKQAAEPVKPDAVEVKQAAEPVKSGYRSEIDGIEVDFELQYREHETDMKDIAARVTEDYVRRGNDASKIELIQVYLKPTDFTAYYVINNSYEGKIPLF